MQHVLLAMPNAKHPRSLVEVLVLLLGVALVLLLVMLLAEQTASMHPMVLAEAQTQAVKK